MIRHPLTTQRLWSTADLRRDATKRQIAAAVAAGRLARVRRGFYVGADIHPDLARCAALHARLDCVSLLRLLGVFVRDAHGLHVQVERGTTEVVACPPGVVRHWRSSALPSHALTSDVVEALAQACRCQPELAAIATLDSALHLGLVDRAGLAEVFARLPRRLRRLLRHLERRSESGPESILRVLLRRLGHRVEVQVTIPGVGRVDLVVDGWLIIECDSEAHHSSWEQQKRDRRRDQAAAALGYTTYRPIAEDIMWHTDDVLAGVAGFVAARTSAAVLNLADPSARVRL